MNPQPSRLAGLLVLLLSTPAAASGLLDRLAAQVPDASVEVLALALEARECAAAKGVAPAAERLAVIDYSRPSTEPRLWVFDLADEPRLLYAEHVAHGKGSGENVAQSFSNREGSQQSSLGLFLTAETYHGGNGHSLRLDGLESGTNDLARERLIVMHGAPYVDPDLAQRQGRLGRSFGCPAVREEVAQEVIDTLRGGQLLFAYYPDSDWLTASPFLGCRSDRMAGVAGKGTAFSLVP